MPVNLEQLQAWLGDLSPYQQAPAFWLATPARGLPFIRTLKEATVHSLGRSAGGRDILAIEYGQKEALDATTDNLQSAIAAKVVPPDPTEIFPAPFYGATRREKPVVVLQGAIHGMEITGSVASLNLCRIIETGSDLRGRAWPDLQALARRVRLCIIPWLNMDGADRAPVCNCERLPGKIGEALSMGIRRNGTAFQYPAVKSLFPIPLVDSGFMGCYFNDAGFNLQYDFCRVTRQPETEAWMRYYLDERPDGVLIFHGNAGSLIGPPGHFLPVGHQLLETRVAGAVRARLQREGYGHPVAGRISWAHLPGMGKPYLDQSSAVYHASGATPVMCELPSGGEGYFCSCDDMLTIGLLVCEEVLRFAVYDGFRPYEFREKIVAAQKKN